MRIRELTEADNVAVLERSELGRLACARNNQPYIVPIYFNFDPDRRCLYAFSGVGQKIRWMRDNPNVCVAVDEIADKDHWTTVLIFGWYEELGDSAEDREARRRAQQLFESRPEWWLPATGKTATREPYAMVIYRIRIDRMSGRHAARSGS